MKTLHHKPIKKFGLEGIMYDDVARSRLKKEYISLLISEMKSCGYVPRLDIDPDFTIEFNHQKKYFEFHLSIYGIFVGKKKASWIIGVDETRVITTQKNKLGEFLREVA
jgi:hypothetical protein